MIDQLEFPVITPCRPLIHPEHQRGATLEERFQAFHAANPWVYTRLVRLARQYRARDRRCAIATLFEVLRNEHDLQTNGDPFKLNNSYRSRYARRIMARESDLAGIFHTRELKS